MELSNAQRALIEIAYESLMALTDEIPLNSEWEGTQDLWKSFDGISDLKDLIR